jgi:hypothetical protein
MPSEEELGTMTSLLDLEEFDVVEAERDRARKLRRFTLVPHATAGVCPHCGGICDERHLCHDRTVTTTENVPATVLVKLCRDMR